MGKLLFLRIILWSNLWKKNGGDFRFINSRFEARNADDIRLAGEGILTEYDITPTSRLLCYTLIGKEADKTNIQADTSYGIAKWRVFTIGNTSN